MPDENEQDALSKIKAYVDAGHSIQAVREAGWGEWLDYFASKGVSLDDAQLDPPPPDTQPPEAEQARPAPEAGTEAEAEQQATSSRESGDGPSILGRIASFFSFGSKIAPEAQEALRTYLAAEWKLAAFQDVKAGEYNEVLTKYGGSATPGSPAFGEHIVPAARSLKATAAELVRRQRQMGPVHDEAARAYFAWQATYLAYENWVEAAVAAYEGLAEGETPHLQRVEDLFGEQQRAGDTAQKELMKLAGRLGMNAEEVRRTMQQAEDLGKEEARMWSG